MKNMVLAKLPPTWETIEFGQHLEVIPQRAKSNCGFNPMRKDLALSGYRFEYGYVYAMPYTDKTLTTEHPLKTYELADLFGTPVNNIYATYELFPGEHTYRFSHEMVIGDCFVSRIFEVVIEWVKNGEHDCRFSMTAPEEICRYVFHDDRVILEKSDHTRSEITPELIDTKDIYDTLAEDIVYQARLKELFIRNVCIARKREIIASLQRNTPISISHRRPTFELCSFTELFRLANRKEHISEKIPDEIRYDLRNREYGSNAKIRINRNLALINIDADAYYSPRRLNPRIRIYFDWDHIWFFQQNVLTKEWIEGNYRDFLKKKPQYYYRFDYQCRDNLSGMLIDRDILENTCAERYLDTATVRGQKIQLYWLLAQAGFLCAKQAAKTDKDLFEQVLNNINDGTINEKNISKDISLPELLGLTGVQLKFLKGKTFSVNLVQFGNLMRDQQFIHAFPDVQKRIFAVRLCTSLWGGNDSYRQIVIEAAQTLNHLEKKYRNGEPSDRLLTEYWDYLKMRERFLKCVNSMAEDSPMRQEILEFGEVPVNIKPSRIREYHRKLCRAMILIDHAEKIVKYTPLIEERKRKEAKDWEYADDTYSILMPTDVREIIREGRELQHCVGNAGYIERMAGGKCTILFLRKKEAPEKPFLTLEIRQGNITQCYGFRDKFNDDPMAGEFLTEYAAGHQLKISATVFKEKR